MSTFNLFFFLFLQTMGNKLSRIKRRIHMLFGLVYGLLECSWHQTCDICCRPAHRHGSPEVWTSCVAPTAPGGSIQVRSTSDPESFCNKIPPRHVRIHIAQEQRQEQIQHKKKEEKVKLQHDIVRKLDKNKKRHDEARKKLFLEYTEEMCDEEQSVNGNGRRKRAQCESLPVAGCNIK